ncbi:MAG: single-stranded DNA-binding protein [Candidatus Cloacimonetes bacterium]|nr:single-stranded DNA-binding protein [Candidatus Cloacimonadota bacterium]
MAKKLSFPRVNYVIISGRLTRDVELRYTPSGTPTANIGIASDRSYRDSDGNWQQETSFLRVVAWTRQAEWAAENLKKGSPVIIEGRIQSRNWQDKDDKPRTTVEIVASRIQRLEREFEEGEESPSKPETAKEKELKEDEQKEDNIPF